ncbi:hypothetical protein SAMN02745119_01883 [Trichlorobacter thiogenes]|uniref:Bacterial repeat domain-containing protein n=1 Tax=Trichlorobacter thiogenes TaxID=115783 RepID=A0A1T4P911_9BACT|nr:hypothetical protein [Trichlorobacter thiogenes]SJZ87962.1 hypothetical protein SAMN02745119_01883 [Trichlorobacter thiogenes]
MRHIFSSGIIAGLALLSFVTAALASNISSTEKYAWSETSGWINFAPSSGGVTLYVDHLEGFAWSESIGWIKLGSHTDGGSFIYANTSNADWGVNRIGDALSGFAWSETSGWINFAPSGGGVTINSTTGALDGFGWSEALGWLHLKGTATNADSYGVRVIMPTLTVTISGNGSVTSHNDSGTNYTCNTPGVCQPVTFNLSDTVTLTATGSNSTFSSWSGDYVSISNPGSITMSANKAVTATFSPGAATVKIDGDSTAYYSINSALAAPVQDATIRATAIGFAENVILQNSHTLTLTLKGGYSDSTFSSQTGYSTINGSLTISSGTLVVDKVVVGP